MASNQLQRNDMRIIGHGMTPDRYRNPLSPGLGRQAWHRSAAWPGLSLSRQASLPACPRLAIDTAIHLIYDIRIYPYLSVYLSYPLPFPFWRATLARAHMPRPKARAPDLRRPFLKLPRLGGLAGDVLGPPAMRQNLTDATQGVAQLTLRIDLQ